MPSGYTVVAAFESTPTFVAKVEEIVTAYEGVVFVNVTALMSANAPAHAINETQWFLALRTPPTDCGSGLAVFNSMLALSFVVTQQ